VPTLPASEGRRQAAYLAEKGTCLLCRYLALELDRAERIVLQNDSFVVLVPFWAFWPFEVMILPREHGGDIARLGTDQKRDLADAISRLTVRYDNLFQTAFPYTMGLHQQPTDGKSHREWHWHIHYLPPLLRSRAVKKFMVGYEMLAMPQRDLTAEACAQRLRGLSEIHYRESTK
jgi:UDPglucose--hexose-1-phosphate uridylyltransferase